MAVHHCIHGSAYDAKVWRRELPVAEQVILTAAGRAGAVVTFPESLYSYGAVEGLMTEDLPRDATRGKLGVRADLLRARAASSTPNVSVVARTSTGRWCGPPTRASGSSRRSSRGDAWPWSETSTSRTRSPMSLTSRGR